MSLVNTIIIPLDDPVTAAQEYSAALHSQKVLLIILGDSDSIQSGIELADELADTSPLGIPRGVLWVANHITLKDEIAPILEAAGIIQHDTPYEEIKAFCLTTPDREANSRVHKNGVLDFVRLEHLFVEAEANSN